MRRTKSLTVSASLAVGLVVSACMQPAPASLSDQQSPSGSPASTPATVAAGPPAMPVGTVAFFALGSCPEGWSAAPAVAGRTVVGLPSAGTPGGTVGDALGDLEDRVHTHTVGAVTASTTTVLAHSHTVDPPRSITPGWDSMEAHVVGGADSVAYIIGKPSHNHTVDIPAFESTAVGEHTHRVTLPEAQTSAASTSQAMSYLQLLACRNDSMTAAVMPTGTVAFFVLATCPEGWSELVEARGRAVVGLGSGATLLGTVGDPLGDLEERSHSHAVGPVTVETTAVANHVHSVNPPQTETTAYAAASVRVVGVINGDGYIIGAESHSHTLNIPAFNTAPAGGHSHRVTTRQTQTTGVDTRSVMPYLQLLACRNDSATVRATPPSTVVFSTLATCSAGWSELAEARGRAVVGLSVGGTVQGIVGDALGDVENRVHSHGFITQRYGTTAVPDHVHKVDPPSTMTSFFDLATARVQFPTDSLDAINREARHQHEIDIPPFDSAPAGGHAHEVTFQGTATTTASTGQVMPYVQLLACKKD